MKMKTMKKQLAVAVTVALLTLPLSTSMVLAETVPTSNTTSTTPETTTPETTTPETTTPETTTPETTTPETTTPETTTPETTTPETTPVTDGDGNEVAPTNWLTNLIIELQLALTFDPASKCELSEKHALAKLAEAQKLMTEGNTEASQIAFEEYSEKVTKALEFLEQVENPDSEKAKKLTIALTNVNANNINVLSNLLDKLPPQAAQKLALNVVRSMEKAVTKIEKQEAKVAQATPSETTSETVPTTTTPVAVTTPATTSTERDRSLEKQAKVALKGFKKSLKEKCKIQLEDAEQQDDEDNDSEDTTPSAEALSMSSSQPTSVTVAPAELQKAPTSIQSSVQDKRERTKKDEQGKDKSRDKQDKSDKQD